MSARVSKALRKLLAQHRNKKILLIAHGITNRAVLGSLRGLATAEAFALPSQANDEVFVVTQSGNASEHKAIKLAAETEAEKQRADDRGAHESGKICSYSNLSYVFTSYVIESKNNKR